MHAGHPPPRSANGIFRICSSEVLTPRRQIRRTPSLIHADSLGKSDNADLRGRFSNQSRRQGSDGDGQSPACLDRLSALIGRSGSSITTTAAPLPSSVSAPTQHQLREDICLDFTMRIVRTLVDHTTGVDS